MRTEIIEKRSAVLFAVVTISAVTLILASQHASAAVVVHHHHTVHVLVDPQAHGNPDKVLANATAMKAMTKGPYGETDIIGGMMSGGY
jgi:hypothetical protein